MAKYLTQQQIQDIIGVLKLPEGFALMSQDSYNEEQIASKIAKSGGQNDLFMAALNMSIVGYGNQKYGNYRINDQIINISQVFVKYGVKYNNNKMAILKDDEITPQRLCRFYRHATRQHIYTTKSQPYLWRKYSSRDARFMHICFRGAEYLDDLSLEEASYLLLTVKQMDARLNTNISERVIRVFEAKNTKFKI
jgi:hypothetical protein